MADHNDELLPETTEGFKVGEKKTLDEYHQMGKLPTLSMLGAAKVQNIARQHPLFLLSSPTIIWSAVPGLNLAIRARNGHHPI
jgi:hypothetical protein